MSRKRTLMDNDSRITETLVCRVFQKVSHVETGFTPEIPTLKGKLTYFRMLMHIVTCSNYFDLNKTVALRTKKDFSNKFSSNLSILLAENISVPDKSRKFAPCVRVDYENKTKPFSSILYRCTGVYC